VIAIKAELAGRLLPHGGDRARSEVADIESVARTALGEVRDAVSGYRQPTLDGELAGARMALDAAGVSCEVERANAPLHPDAEAILAWAVREGATNVIRHSRARQCTVRVVAADGVASVEVVDDGGGDVDGGPEVTGGAGLSGLRERVGEVRGTVAAGPLAGGGYRLAVTVPVPGRLS
jgi:two-component system sensor histidine kinase DesK